MKNNDVLKVLYDINNLIEGKEYIDFKINEKQTLKLIDNTNEDNNIELKYKEENIICLKEQIEFRHKIIKLKEKKKTLYILKDLINYSKEKLVTHNQANKEYTCKNLGFVIPSIIITGISGIISFISSSSLIADNNKDYLMIGVGILASIATLIQSFSSAMNYNGKAEAHSIAADEYDNLYTIVSFEMEHPTESISDPDKFYSDIKNNILEVKKKCNYQIPNKIIENYNKNVVNNRFDDVKNKILQEAIYKKADGIRKKLIEIKNPNEIDLDKIKDTIEFNLH